MNKNISNAILLSLLVFTLMAFSSGNLQAQPPAPTNLTTGATTIGSIVLNWTPSGGTTDGYRIVWKPGNATFSSQTDGGFHTVAGAGTNTYTVTGLQSGQLYTFAIYSTATYQFSLTAPTATGTTNAISLTTFTNEQSMSLILGQNSVEDFGNVNLGGLSANSMYGPSDVFILEGTALNSEGKMFVADKYNNRVLIYNTIPTSNNQTADIVIGQTNFTSNGSGNTANKLNGPSSVVSDGTRLFIADEGNNRILVYNTIPVTNGASADVVLGQTTFGAGHTAANNGGRSASSLYLNDGSAYGTGMALASVNFSNKLIVCDGANDRVLIWNDYLNLSNGKAADVEIGQTNFTSHSQPGYNASSLSTLYSPKDLAVTSTGKLIIVSRLEHRALIFNSIPNFNNASADLVLGQANSSDNQANFTYTSTSFGFPRSVAISKISNKLCIATSGDRLLVWNTFPTTNNQAADNVIGYPDLNTNSRTTFSNENNGGFSNNASNVSFVDGMCWTAGGNLLCADANRNAVLKFNGGDEIITSPSSVTAGTITDNSITINWSGNPSGYYDVVYRYGTTPPSGYDDPNIAESFDNVTGNTLTIHPPCGVQLSFAVIAKNAQYGSQYAPVNGTLNVTTGSSASCLNFPIVANYGVVKQIIPSITGDTIFAAGLFSKLYSKSGTMYTRNNLFAINASTGEVLNWSCPTDGIINGMCLDKSTGKIYIGGLFNNAGGFARKYVACLNSDGSINTSFVPPSFNDGIGGGGGTCMTLNQTGDTLYFWGFFSNVTDANNNNFTRHHIAALLTSDGSLSTFDTPDDYLSPGSCRFFTLSPNGKYIIVGSNAGAAQNLATINLATGMHDFDFNVDGGLCACGWYDGSKYMYFGGGFSQFMGNTNIHKLAKVDMSGETPVLVSTYNNSAATYPGSTVRCISGTSTNLYLEGDFFAVGGTARQHLASVSTNDCSLSSWDLNLSSDYSNGTAGNLFISKKYGISYISFVNAPNFTNFIEYPVPLSPSSVNGSASSAVGASSNVTFSNSGGILAKLSTNTSNLGNTTVTVSGANGDTTVINGFTVMDRIVTITPTTQPTDNVTVHIYATKAEMDFFASIHPTFGNSGNNYNGCKVHRLGAGNAYVQSFTPTITINGDIVDISFDTPGFSSFAMSDDGVLPVELAAFTSSVNKNNVTLNWRTTSELNNSGFDIERKKSNETEWNKIGNITGKGTSNTENIYKFEDKNTPSASYNYRLKQIDFNGNYRYYDLVNVVTVGVPNKWDISQNYPNPFNPATKINFDIPKESFVKINVYDVSGRLVANLVNEKKDAGYFTVEFNASSLSSSVYFYRIETEAFTMTKKMMVVK